MSYRNTASFGRRWEYIVVAELSFKPRENYFFIFYTEDYPHFWVMPSRDVARLGYTNGSGKNEGKLTLNLPRSDTARNACKYAKYCDDRGCRLLRKRSRRRA